ncbi:tRNA pseudouridine(38-40) synthase TruA [Haloimpatiens sp. FM7315]|uniref:tRNA pseudouridine(38-40) synthase TruA n=1 Tax=Haloimpatiens sp. FM7315 TaxID=3298609 RepID=UPI0035A3CD3C
MVTRNIKLTIEYDGTNYCGWQKQNSQRTVQGTIEKAIRDLTKEENLNLIGCSRTDSGVHAKGFVANFTTNSSIPSNKFREAINARLPKDIVILLSEQMPSAFHSRYDSKGKKYVYSILNRAEKCAIGRNYIYSFGRELDLNSINCACKYFIGTHDFSAFKSQGSSVKTSVRTIFDLDVKKDGDIITVSASGDGFLYNMVRIIVGTLLDVGVGKIEPKDVEKIIESKDRLKAGAVVPALGLCLQKVFY